MGDRYVQEARAGGNASVREGRAQGEEGRRAAVNKVPVPQLARTARTSERALDTHDLRREWC